MTQPEPFPAVESGAAVCASHVASATERAMFNILDGFQSDRSLSDDMQKAMLNILEDFDVERVKVDRMNAELQREVIERKNAEESYARSNADLEQFAYVASHDLSEPLRAISGPISLVARRYEGKLDPESDQFIAFAVDGCQRMQAIIEGLLAYSRVGRLEAPFEPVDCNMLLATVLGWLAPVIDAAGGEVSVGDLPMVIGDGTQLSQVFLNLISNAVKFVAPGVAPRVDVRAERVAGEWRFSVTDNGIGIVPEHRDRVFGMFKRLHGREDYAGTGIGLALVKKIVERHGGTIGVDEGPEGGSRFWFTIDATIDAEVER